MHPVKCHFVAIPVGIIEQGKLYHYSHSRESDIIYFMDIESYLEFLKKIVSLVPFNIFDYVVIAVLLIYIFEDISFGIIPAGIGFVSTLCAFFLGIIFYPFFSEFIVKNFSLTKGFSDAISFLFVTGAGFILVSTIFNFFRRRYIFLVFPKIANMAGGAFFGVLSYFFIASFAVALLLSFPVSETIKDSIRQSVSGRFFFTRTQGIESAVRKIFGGAIEETINFLTIKPGSNESIRLNFSTRSYKIDEKSQNKMLEMINEERRKKNLGEIVRDEKLLQVAQEHAKDMLERGYFSHYTPEGLSPFDRMEMANIPFQSAGENLAFAPDVQIAMDGLMKSPGHKQNILSPNFKKGGIGVIDAGIFGKMFVQEFAD